MCCMTRACIIWILLTHAFKHTYNNENAWLDSQQVQQSSQTIK